MSETREPSSDSAAEGLGQAPTSATPPNETSSAPVYEAAAPGTPATQAPRPKESAPPSPYHQRLQPNPPGQYPPPYGPGQYPPPYGQGQYPPPYPQGQYPPHLWQTQYTRQDRPDSPPAPGAPDAPSSSSGGSGAPPPPGPWTQPLPPDPWGRRHDLPPGGWGVPAYWSPPRHTSNPQTLRAVVAALVVVIIAAVGVAAGRYSINNGTSGNSGTGAFQPTSPGAASASSAVAAKVDPAVVDITTQLGFQSGEAAGTGIVLSASGEVLTNNHVVAGATSISATDVGNGRTYTAVVVGTDKADDIAVVRLLGASGLKSVSIGDSSTLGVGAAVTAIGNAGGQGGAPSVSAGTVTALDQSITANDQADGTSEQLSGLIQTNAELEPGDSGGPLVNAKGEVVGIDTAASSGFEFQTGSSQGFAIPINKATAIERQIVAGQGSATVHIGAAAFLGIEVNASSGSGAQVVVVEPGTPADHAGIVDGDVIVSLGGQTVDSPTTLTNLMQRHHPGDRVELGWVDQGGQHHSATVQLAIGPAG